jgi:hypothetical protein
LQSVEIVVKAAGDPMVLTFSASDSAEVIAERLRTLTWIIRQVSGAPADFRRRGARGSRDAATEALATTTTAAVTE